MRTVVTGPRVVFLSESENLSVLAQRLSCARTTGISLPCRPAGLVSRDTKYQNDIAKSLSPKVGAPDPAMANGGLNARNVVSQLKGLDTSGVEVDEEQVAPTVAAGSDEEMALLARMEEALEATGDKEAIAAPSSIKLMCLRGRKYDVARAVELVSKHLAMRKMLFTDVSGNEQLVADLHSHKVVNTGAKDVDGRAVLWLRLRFHDPTQSKPVDMARLLVTVMLEALKDVEVQRAGIAIINDVNGVSFKNIHPPTVKFMFKEVSAWAQPGHSCCAVALPTTHVHARAQVFPAMPVRVGRICILQPPWIFGHIVIPVVLTFMSKKLRGRCAARRSAVPCHSCHVTPLSCSPCNETRAHLTAVSSSSRRADRLPRCSRHTLQPPLCQLSMAAAYHGMQRRGRRGW